MSTIEPLSRIVWHLLGTKQTSKSHETLASSYCITMTYIMITNVCVCLRQQILPQSTTATQSVGGENTGRRQKLERCVNKRNKIGGTSELPGSFLKSLNVKILLWYICLPAGNPCLQNSSHILSCAESCHMHFQHSFIYPSSGQGFPILFVPSLFTGGTHTKKQNFTLCQGCIACKNYPIDLKLNYKVFHDFSWMHRKSKFFPFVLQVL